jgi:plasmid stability protein
MSPLTLRITDEDLKQKLKEEAEKHGRSMTEEARVILRIALLKSYPTPKYNSTTELYDAIRAIVEPLDGIDLDLPPRTLACNEPCCSRKQTD